MFSDELRQHVEQAASDHGAQYAICEATGFLVSESHLSGFLHAGCNLSLKRVDALCEALNLELVRRPGQSPVEAERAKTAAQIAAYREKHGRAG